MSKAIVVFSGGQDSTTCLFHALNKYDEVEAITFDYNQRHKNEIKQAKKIAKDNNVQHQLIDVSLLNQLTTSALTRNIDIKHDSNRDLPNTFVPGRNILFLTIAGIIADRKNADVIVTGVSQTDFSGYPDCRHSFIKAMNTAIIQGLDKNILIETPLMWIDKKETWALADKLGKLEYIRDNTLTCYNGVIGEGCGECPACELRNKGLEEYLNDQQLQK